MDFTLILFYLFGSILIGSALAAVSTRHMVHSVLFLILCFFNAAALFIMVGAEFIAMLLVIVYVGAIAVLFLFVVMMLNTDVKKIKERLNISTPVLGFFSIVIFIELFAILKISLGKDYSKFKLFPIDQKMSNVENIGNALYTQYFLPFQISGAILFVAMIGAIVLTLNKNDRFIKKQVIKDQILRSKTDSIEIVKIETGKGIDL